MESYITFNGIKLPCPSESPYQSQQFVNEARNALGEFRGQKINRRMDRLSLTWNLLYPDEIKVIRQCIETFEGTVRYFDILSGSFIERKMYWGDFEATPYGIDKTTKEPIFYTNITASLIDEGLPD